MHDMVAYRDDGGIRTAFERFEAYGADVVVVVAETGFAPLEVHCGVTLATLHRVCVCGGEGWGPM